MALPPLLERHRQCAIQSSRNPGLVIGIDQQGRVQFDRGFHFQQSHIVEVPLGVSAETLVEFRAGLATVDESAIYLHTVETRARERRAEAFSEWLRDSLEMSELAERFERTDPYLTSLERIRGRLLALVDTALDETRR